MSQLVKPVYPPLGLQARLQGSVQLSFQVDARGQVGEIETQRHPWLRTIEESVRQSRLDPANCGGKGFKLTCRFEIVEGTPIGGVFEYRAPDTMLFRKRFWLNRLFRRR